MEPLENHREEQSSLLTCIHGPYTLSNTEADHTAEVEKVMLDNFLRTLAEISLAIAARIPSNEDKESSQ